MTASGQVEYTYWVSPSAPANTASSSPASTAVAVPALSWLWRVEVRIPPGHQGLTGLALVDGDAYIVPYAAQGQAWLIGDDDLLEYPYGKEVGNSVVFLAYNTDTTYDHAWQCRLIYTPISALEDGEVIVTPDVAAWLEEVSG